MINNCLTCRAHASAKAKQSLIQLSWIQYQYHTHYIWIFISFCNSSPLCMKWPYTVLNSVLCCLPVLSWFLTAHESPHMTDRGPLGLSEHMGTECELPNKRSNCQRNWRPHGNMLACLWEPMYRLHLKERLGQVGCQSSDNMEVKTWLQTNFLHLTFSLRCTST